MLASPEPTTTPFARCRACGIYDCWYTDVAIHRVGDEVRWTWSGRAVPPLAEARFDAEAYEAEVTRVAADFSWEKTPVRTAGRRALVGIQPLLPAGVMSTSMANVYRNAPDRFDLTLEIPDRYQIRLTFPWRGDPEALAREVCEVLAQPPERWPAEWLGNPPELREIPPPIAGPSWRRWYLEND